MDFSQLLDKVKKIAREHPAQAQGAVDKVAGILDARTGRKFSSQIQNGGRAVKSHLGLSPDAP